MIRMVSSLIVRALSLAALAFPFSVAATNICLAVALAAGLLSGSWWHGVQYLWREQRWLFLALGLYLLWAPLGLLWSADVRHGLEVLGHYWFWLLLPVVVVALSRERDRNMVLGCLSVGLTLNLLYCVLQAMGYVDVATDGSGVRDATGHIGHIGFGFVYALWAAWLLYLGLRWHGWRRWGCWALVLWACIMVFMAQGRAGYVLMILLLMSVVVKWAWLHYRRVHAFSLLGGMALLLVLVMMLGPGKERIAGTWLAWHGEVHQSSSWDEKMAMLSTHQRLSMWQTAWNVWQKHPFVGVGTGGFLQAAKPVFEQRVHRKMTLSHPHNQYLLVLARWGITGLVCLLLLLVIWVRNGWHRDWNSSEVVPLMFLAGFALTIDGMFSITLEQHFSAILAILLLGASLAARAVHDESRADARPAANG